MAAGSHNQTRTAALASRHAATRCPSPLPPSPPPPVQVIRRLGVVGECNIQYALNPVSEKYW